jgi:hypothetical protein
VKSGFIALAGLCVIAAVGVAFAHHGTASYDMNTEVTLTGTVKDWTFENPHSWLWLNLTSPNGAAEEWSIESAPPNYLTRQGWSATTLKPGEKLTVLISPLRRESKRGILLEVKRSNGEVLMVRPRGSFGRPKSID